MEAHRAGKEARVRCLMLPGRREMPDISSQTPPRPAVVRLTRKGLYLSKDLAPKTTPLKGSPTKS